MWQRVAVCKQDDSCRLLLLAFSIAQLVRDARKMFEAGTRLQAHDVACAAARFSPGDGALVATCSADRTVRLWQSDGGEAVSDLYGPHHAGVNDVTWCAASPQYLCSASDDRTLVMWDAEKAKPLRVLRGHASYVLCVAYNRWGNLIASGSYDRSVRLWDVRSGKCIRQLPAHTDPVTAVDFHRSGEQIISSSFDGLCRLWDVESGECRQTLFEDANPAVSHVRYSPNGRFALASNLDGTLRLWDCKSKRRVRIYRGHKNEAFCLANAFAAHDKERPQVLGGSEDGMVHVWDLQSGDTVDRLQHGDEEERVLCVDAHPVRRTIVSAGSSGSVRFWNWSSERVGEKRKAESQPAA